MKFVTIIGARPQFIKAAAMSRVLRKKHDEILLHTGQHYDDNMSSVFFEELGIPEPDINLNAGSGSHGRQTGLMLELIEKVLIHEKPDRVLVYGDTNSTLAGALAASKLNIPVAHIEAGLRSFNRNMPEEINRVLTDHISDLLLCPSTVAVNNLKAEGIVKGVHLVGDVMADALNFASKQSALFSDILQKLEIKEKKYILATVHRQENTDNYERLQSIMNALILLDETVIFPVHPRTNSCLKKIQFRTTNSNIKFIPPVGYLDMVMLEKSARMILTDSGGIQKEAYWLKVPCITLRDETEWIETVETGWNILAGADEERIIRFVKNFNIPQNHPPLYGYGKAVLNCIDLL